MPIDLLGKMLFPRLQPWQRRKQARILVSVSLVALFFALAIAAVIYWRNTVH